MALPSSFMCFMIAGLILALLTNDSQAQNSPQDYLVPHNRARAEVGVGPMTWDNTVAAYAENYANQRVGDCVLQHSTNRPYGENLSGSTVSLSVGDAVKLWVDEKQYYNHASNSCEAGERKCLHYTQVVWAKSVRLGCASVTCNNGGTFVICSYDPPGNNVGESPY